MAPDTETLQQTFGAIDIYLFDQLLKARLKPGMKILEAGCGNGRNLIYFLRNGFNVHAVDTNAEAISQVRALAAHLGSRLQQKNFLVSDLDELPHGDDTFDAIICCAVLHFARDESHFDRMLNQLWRVVKPGGIFFARLASTITMEDRLRHLHGRWYAMPDGSERFLVDEELLHLKTEQLGGKLLDPLKTTNVQNLRAMTTWVLQKGLNNVDSIQEQITVFRRSERDHT